SRSAWELPAWRSSAPCRGRPAHGSTQRLPAPARCSGRRRRAPGRRRRRCRGGRRSLPVPQAQGLGECDDAATAIRPPPVPLVLPRVAEVGPRGPAGDAAVGAATMLRDSGQRTAHRYAGCAVPNDVRCATAGWRPGPRRICEPVIPAELALTVLTRPGVAAG